MPAADSPITLLIYARALESPTIDETCSPESSTKASRKWRNIGAGQGGAVLTQANVVLIKANTRHPENEDAFRNDFKQ